MSTEPPRPACLFFSEVLPQLADAVPAHGEAHAEEEAAADGHDDDVGVGGEEGQRVLPVGQATVGLLVQLLVAVEVAVADQGAVDAVQVVTVELSRQTLLCMTDNEAQLV